MLNYITYAEDQVTYYAIAPTTDLPNGERLFVEIGKHTIVVFNIAGSYYAIGDVCSHDNGPVGDGDVEDYEIICPRHGARFDIRSGKVTRFPAVEDIPAYPVRVVDGQIEIGVPKEYER